MEESKTTRPPRTAAPPATQPKIRKGLRWLRAGVTLILILVILQWIDFDILLKTIRRTDWRYVLLILPTALLDRYLMAYKWNMLLRVRGVAFSNWEAFRIYMASGFVSLTLPSGLGGDVFRVARMKMSGRKMSDATASIFLERVVGLLATASLAIIGLSVILGAGADGHYQRIYYATWLLFILTLTGLFLSIHTRTFNLMRRVLSGFEKIRLIRMFLDFQHVYMELGHYSKTLLYVFILSFLEHGILATMNFWGARGIGVSLGMSYFFAIIPLASLVLIIPISIAGIGVSEGSYIILFSRAGLSPSESLALVLIMRVIGWMVLIPCGVAFLYESTALKRIDDPM